MSKFNVGDRVRIREGAESWSKHCKPGFITTVIRTDGVDEEEYRVRDPAENEYGTGWGYPAEHLELVTKGGAQMGRKTYKLIKELPELRKDALLQEKCDDGTQDFKVLDHSFIKYVGEYGSKSFIYPRKAVELEPKWFVEVFQVEPQFMTREELDRWEAFQATKTKTVALKVAKAPKTTVKAGWTPERRAAQSKKIKAAWAAKKAA